MAWLTIDSVDIPVEDGGSNEERLAAIQQRRALDGTMRESHSGSYKSEWSFTTGYLTTAEKNTLETKLESTPPISCSGDALGGSVSCHAADYEVEPITPAGDRWQASFRLLEA